MLSPKAIYVNLPVADLSLSIAFFKAVGFSFNPQFTNDQAAALVISDTIFAMLHTPESIRRYTKKDIADAHKTTEVLLALQVETKKDVDGLMVKVLSNGSKEQRDAEDHGFMYARAFEDPDGHIWEIFWMEATPNAQ